MALKRMGGIKISTTTTEKYRDIKKGQEKEAWKSGKGRGQPGVRNQVEKRSLAEGERAKRSYKRQSDPYA